MRHLPVIAFLALGSIVAPLAAQIEDDWAEEEVIDASDPDAIMLIDRDGETEWNEEEDDFPDDGIDSEPVEFAENEDGFTDTLPIVQRPAGENAPPPPPPPPPGSGGISLRVSVGHIVRENTAPFQAQIAYAVSPRQWRPASTQRLANNPDWELRHVCGGALIERDWVLTAAHCVSRAHFRRGLVVMLGAEDISNTADGQTFKVDRLVIHSGYNKYANDIALVHLAPDSRARNGGGIGTIEPHTGGEPTEGTPVSGYGWGRTQQAGPTVSYSALLWRASQKIIPISECRQRDGFGAIEDDDGPSERIGNTVLCAGDSPSKTCSGDSGGPLVMNEGGLKLAGIVSWNKRDCSNPRNPGVYTRVASFQNWITRAKALPASRGAVQFLGN